MVKLRVFDSLLLEKVDGSLDVRDPLSVFVGDLKGAAVRAELLLEGHYQLYEVQRVGVEVFGKRRLRDDFILVNA